MPKIAYWNGRFVHPDDPVVPIEERGHQFGDGVYEVVRVYHGRPFLLHRHLLRLKRSLSAICIDNPHTDEEWAELVEDAIGRSDEQDAMVYLQVTRGIAERAHLFPAVQPSVCLTVRPVTAPALDARGSLLCLPDNRFADVWIKSINLLPNIAAKEMAHRVGALEALFVRNGVITEGSSSNAWFVRDGELWTAPDNRYILAGITRSFVLDLTERLGLAVHMEAIALEELATVDEIFMTGTTTEILPITAVFADARKMSYLKALPDSVKEPLVASVESVHTLWERPLDDGGLLTMKLQQAFRHVIADAASWPRV